MNQLNPEWHLRKSRFHANKSSVQKDRCWRNNIKIKTKISKISCIHANYIINYELWLYHIFCDRRVRQVDLKGFKCRPSRRSATYWVDTMTFGFRSFICEKYLLVYHKIVIKLHSVSKFEEIEQSYLLHPLPDWWKVCIVDGSRADFKWKYFIKIIYSNCNAFNGKWSWKKRIISTVSITIKMNPLNLNPFSHLNWFHGSIKAIYKIDI